MTTTALADPGDDDERPAVPVNPPEGPRTIDATVIASRVHDKRPIIPPWLRNRDEFRALARYLARYGGHISGFHAARSPMYAARLAWRSPRGAWRLARAGARWVFDVEQAALRGDAVRRKAVDEYLHLSKQRQLRVRHRAAWAAAWAALAVVAALVLVLNAPLLVSWLALVLAIAALGVHGTPADRRVLDVATVSPYAPAPLRADAVTAALQALGVASMTEKSGVISYPAPIRDIGSGWLASIDLPLGVTPGMVMDRRGRLASGLRRPLGCVWPESDQDAHGGRLELTVLKIEMSKARQSPYPWRTSGVGDIFGSLPFGTDQRGRPVCIPLTESNMLIGALPGAGKTAALRCVLVGCALDPTAELHVWELKGSGDLESLERVSHSYGSGVDDKTIEACLIRLRWLLAELEARADKLKALRKTARDLVPDSKVTRNLANQRKLGLYPIIFTVDEAQELFSHSEFGKEAGELATQIIKRGRALGVILILATQRPDKNSLPTAVSANVGIRLCLRVMGQIENDMILGTSSYQNGIRATLFTRSDRGIGYLVGATDAPVVVRAYYLDAEVADSIIARAYLLRSEAGLLTGHAVDDFDSIVTFDLLSDVRSVFSIAGGERIWNVDLLERLKSLRPDAYDEWTVHKLGAELRKLGVQTKQITEEIDGERVNKRGVYLVDVGPSLARGEQPPEIEA